MSSQDLMRRIAILKRNPQYAQLLPQEDFVRLAADLLTAFQTLQKAIEANKLKGDKGEPGYSPVREFESAVGGYERRFSGLVREVETKLAAIRDGRDGKDAEITPELVRQVAEMASEMVELPDIESLVVTEINRNGLAIIDAVRLSNEKWTQADIEGLQERLDELARYMGSVSGGTIGKQQVYGFFRQFIPVSTTAPQAPKLNDLWVEI